VRLVQDVARYDFPIRLDSNDESAAIISKECFQSRLFIFGMIFLSKHELDGVLASDRCAFARGNKDQFRRLIIPIENTAYLRISRR
jgi:hypothetical protein